MELQIFSRAAEPADADSLGRIMAVSFRSAFAGFISEETLNRCAVVENCAGLMRGILEDGKMNILIGGLGEEPMGLICWSEGEDGWTEIEAIHSMPESWGSGLGEHLLNMACILTRARMGVRLWAFEENRRARRFYEKHGICPAGQRRTSDFDGAMEVRYERRWE